MYDLRLLIYVTKSRKAEMTRILGIGAHVTSLFLELVSVPTDPCFSIRTVDAPSLSCSFRATASPTTPPPITACVKSACRLILVENCRLVAALMIVLEKARVEIMMAYYGSASSTPTRQEKAYSNSN